MTRTLKPCLLAAALFAALGANAQTLYNPTRSAKDQGLGLSSWGSGSISETDETAFEGTNSIRVSSRNYFQGGVISFATPLDLGAAYADKNNQLTLTLQVPGIAKGSGNTGGKGGGAGGKKGGGASGGSGGAPDDLGLNSGAGAGGGPAASTSSTASVERLRLVITTSDGKKSETFFDLKGKVPDAKGWFRGSVPLQSINGFAATNKAVASIALASDAMSTFYLGQAEIMTDSTPIYAQINQGDLNLALGDVVTFVASGDAGSTPLRYDWDFDSSDGIQVDASGQGIKRRFRKAGDYVVTLTVSDLYGLKSPYTTSIKVTVNP